MPSIREVWTPTASNFFGRVGGAYLNDLWRDLLDLSEEHPTATSFAKLKKGEKAAKLEALFSDADTRKALGITEAQGGAHRGMAARGHEVTIAGRAIIARPDPRCQVPAISPLCRSLTALPFELAQASSRIRADFSAKYSIDRQRTMAMAMSTMITENGSAAMIAAVCKVLRAALPPATSKTAATI